MPSVTPTQSGAFTALRAFLLDILPSGTEVLQAQQNRVPEPKADDFVIMTPRRRDRLETNIDRYTDTFFTASIADTTLTVSAIEYGALHIGSVIFGEDVAAGTVITELGSGAGGIGTYTVSPSQTVAGEPMAAGEKTAMQPTLWVVQLDIHGPRSADNAQIVSTLLRDLYGVDFIQAVDPNVTPIDADDPKQIPFVNEQNQYENRWVVEARLQVNETVTGLPQQFADALTVELIEVDTTYPA